MRFLFALAALVGSVFAQSAYIGAPAPGDYIFPGTNITVEVTRPDTITGSVEVAIVLSLQTCVGHAPTGTCDGFDASDTDLGYTLYMGGFHPVFEGPVSAPPHQNFSVFVPTTLPAGPAVLTLSHWCLNGASPQNLFEVRNVTLTAV